MELGICLAILGAGLAVFLAGIGSSIGVGLTGEASNGVISEKPDLFVPLMILTAVPGTQGVYGFVIGFVLLNKLNILAGGDIPNLSVWQGLYFLFACLPVGIAGLLSAIYQGKVCSAGVYMVAKQNKEFVKALILAIFVEFYAVLGLLASLLMINQVNL